MQGHQENLRRQTQRLILGVASVILAFSSLSGANLRRVQIGETMPEFSLTGADGQTLRYLHEQSGVMGLIIVQAKETHLDRLVHDLEVLIEALHGEGTPFACVGVMSGPGAEERLKTRGAGAQAIFPIYPDPNFAFWGKLGVIAVPTAVVVGADHKVQWVKAGYGYDFIPSFHAQLAEAIRPTQHVDASVEVKTLENDSDRARRTRHLQMARALAKKGRYEAAIHELETVRSLDPNAVDAALELAEVLCMAGRNEAALEVLDGAKPQTEHDKARGLLISGCARRQMGQMEAAESLLTSALALEPDSARALYELGRIHESRGQLPQAVSFYRRALAKIFGDVPSAEASQK